MTAFSGCFFYIAWPHSDQARDPEEGFATKKRPALAISEPDAQGDVLLLKATGSPRYPLSVPFSQSDLVAGILIKQSYLRTDRFLTIHHSELHDWGARISKEKLRDCYRAISLSHARSFSRLAHTANRPGDDPLREENAKRLKTEKLKENSEKPRTKNQPVEVAQHFTGQENKEQISASQPFSISASPISVPYAGRVFTEDEVEAAVSATLDFWLTLGPEGEAFEKELAAFLGVKHSLLVNSGSSANLIALTALTSHKLPPHKRIRPGDEIITCAAGFPTTVAPILQNGCVPVFIDNDPATGNARVEQLEAAYSAGKTKAVMMAHTLGNPFDLAAVLAFCKKYDLWLIEDNCDALGCTYSMPVEMAKSLGLEHLLKIAEAGTHPIIRIEPSPLATGHSPLLTAPTGSFGDLSTQSFYPPHHLTMGEGGAVNIIRRPALKTYAESFRDWGRDCWCPSGKDNTCNKRFQWQLGELPEGYDHKYIYSHMGYNLKPLDPQAAIGRVQLRRLPAFIEARKQNWETLRRGLADLDEYFDFSLPTHAIAWENSSVASNELREACADAELTPHSSLATRHPLLSSFSWDSSQCRTDCSWFGFMLRVKPSAPFTVREFAAHLDEKKIGNRMLFGGNLLRQPAFVQLKKDNPEAFRVVGQTETLKTEKLKESQNEPISAFQPFSIPPSASDSSLPADASAFSFQLSTFPPSLPGADEIMHTAIFLGTYPGLTQAQLDYEIAAIRGFVADKVTGRQDDGTEGS